MSAPVPFDPPPEGFRWTAYVRDDWRLVSAKRCRQQGKRHKTCTNEAVAELNRGRIASYVRSDLRTVDSWWAYCADHMYSNWIEDGQVWGWRLEEKPASGFGAGSGAGVARHGTHSGYVRHRQIGETACVECKAAHSQWRAEQHKRQRAARMAGLL